MEVDSVEFADMLLGFGLKHSYILSLTAVYVLPARVTEVFSPQDIFPK
jgi:propanediol dehydratase large subunit